MFGTRFSFQSSIKPLAFYKTKNQVVGQVVEPGGTPLNVVLNSLQARREKQILRVRFVFDHSLLELVTDDRF